MVSGRVRVILKPLLEHLPIVGAIQVPHGLPTMPMYCPVPLLYEGSGPLGMPAARFRSIALCVAHSRWCHMLLLG